VGTGILEKIKFGGVSCGADGLQFRKMLSTDTVELSFATKTIPFFGIERTILLQNENGPCPLLAIANCLILTNRITFPNQIYVGLNSLVSKIAEVALAGSQSRHQVQDEMQMDSILQTIPKLIRGLDLNVQFTTIKAMEFTSELCVFDALGIDVLHGWLLDPQDHVTCDVIQSLSINQLYNELVKCDIATEAERMFQIKCVADEILTEVINNIAFGDAKPTAAPAADVADSDHSVEECKANVDIIRRGGIIKTFIDQSQTQISHHGLCQLLGDMKELQMAVLYRNAHFSTIFKFEGKLYTLVSDEGYRLEKSVVWERFENINGDTEYADASFCRLQPQAPTQVVSASFEQCGDVYSPTICSSTIVVDDNMSSDHTLALMLQQEEDDERRHLQDRNASSPGVANLASTHHDAYQQYQQYQQFDQLRESAPGSKPSQKEKKCTVS
jgi:hypothetical protein